MKIFFELDLTLMLLISSLLISVGIL